MPTKLYKMTALTFSGTATTVRIADALPPLPMGVIPSRKVYVINAPRTVPLPAQVLEGVQYGNNGTEFMGTYSEGAAVWPIENDVRNNVDYGPTGADYNGDLVLPAQTDVKTGVGYGADGTEYTGSYSGGGGGVSRGRVVNT